jgi:uncharacterized DUF497 family protein
VRDQRFEWDDQKERKNRKIHYIAFEDAKHVFNDPRRIIIPDITHGDEERWNVLGLVNQVLFVVYTEREDRIRIISARIATKAEEEVYNDSNIEP